MDILVKMLFVFLNLAWPGGVTYFFSIKISKSLKQNIRPAELKLEGL